MNTNLSWTSALGEAYYSDPQGVLKAIQVMRAQAQAAGTLQSNDQQKVVTQGQTIIIEPANAQVIYVPQYNPTVVYGAPVAAYPGYSRLCSLCDEVDTLLVNLPERAGDLSWLRRNDFYFVCGRHRKRESN